MRIYKLDELRHDGVPIRLLAYARFRTRPNGLERDLRNGRKEFKFYLGAYAWISCEDAQRAYAEYNPIGPEEAERRVNAALRQAR